MKVRNGFVSNSSSSSFVMVYDRDYHRHGDDSSYNNKPENYIFKDTDTITVSEYMKHCDQLVFYTLTKEDMEEFFSEWKDEWKDIEECIYINAKEIDTDDRVTKAMVGKHLFASSVYSNYPPALFDRWSDSLDDFITRCDEWRESKAIHSR